jgi:uncharacterized protein YndB with AHSA1/START domain
MDAKSEKNPTTTERTSDRELTVTRTINGTARLVFEAWTKPELFQRWWVPKSAPITLVSCAMDVRVGGKYRLTFTFQGSDPVDFFGTYLEVVPHSRLAWTNEEAGDAGQVTTVTFEEKAQKTLVTVRDLYPSKAALDEAIASGSTGGLSETLEQLNELVVSLA